MADLSSRFAKAFSAGWPSWQDGDGDRDGPQAPLAIRLSGHIKHKVAKMQLPARPEAIIANVRRQSLERGGDAAVYDKFWAGLEHDLIGVVYGSNLVDWVGTTLSATAEICRAVFRGQDVDAQIDEHDGEYQQHLVHLSETYRMPNLASAVNGRRQTINHAKALVYMIGKVVLDREPLSEAVILETHHILHKGVDKHGEGGKYRNYEVAVAYSEPGEERKTGMCMRASVAPAYLRAVARHLGDEDDEASTGNDKDPYWLATKYKHQFDMVHPFGEGNGLMSRIVLNVLLLKYAGHVVVLGADEDQRGEYLGVVRRGRKIFADQDMEVDFREQTSHCELARLVFAKSKTNLTWMEEWASRVEAEAEGGGLWRVESSWPRGLSSVKAGGAVELSSCRGWRLASS